MEKMQPLYILPSLTALLVLLIKMDQCSSVLVMRNQGKTSKMFTSHISSFYLTLKSGISISFLLM